MAPCHDIAFHSILFTAKTMGYSYWVPHSSAEKHAGTATGINYRDRRIATGAGGKITVQILDGQARCLPDVGKAGRYQMR
jgi:hypothetical protein